MLKRFFLNVLSSFMGAWLAIVVSGLCLMLVVFGIIGIVAGSQSAIEKNSVLKIDLQGELIERENPANLDVMSLLTSGKLEYQAVETLVSALGQAKNDDRIKAVYLDCGILAAAPASVNAVRDALKDFKSSGKKIYAYADQYSQSAYYVATVADELYVNPIGSVDIHGLGGESLFYKDLFDNIGLEFQVVRVGEGKSAVEPYTQNHMSEYARNQTMQLLDTIWGGLRGAMASSRGIASADIDTLINRDIPGIRTGSFAKEHKLVDGTMYRHEFEKHIADAVGQKDGLEHVVKPSTLASVNAVMSPAMGGDNQIAVLYACGGIDNGLEGGINSTDLVNEILELADDENVKGLVLRVNSPGGSAYGSEQIWEAVEYFKKQKKPVAVSMGDYAASGGYYISCGANRIFADKYTITGSIGIFGLIPNIKGLTEKIGLNAEMVSTNPEAQLFTLFEPLNDHQLASLQQMVDDGYELFVKRCADGRHLPVDSIKAIADGRPIAATVAVRYKLVDQIGSLQQAIDWTAAKAGIAKDYNVGVYPFIEPNIFLQMAQQQTVLPAPIQKLFYGRDMDAEMLNMLGGILTSDKLKAEYSVLKVKM